MNSKNDETYLQQLKFHYIFEEKVNDQNDKNVSGVKIHLQIYLKYSEIYRINLMTLLQAI